MKNLIKRMIKKFHKNESLIIKDDFTLYYLNLKISKIIFKESKRDKIYKIYKKTSVLFKFKNIYLKPS